MRLTNRVEIIHVMDHYELYIDGEFVCSGDTKKECLDELSNIEKINREVD